MKPEAQRIAIAEACGWNRCEPRDNGTGGWHHDSQPVYITHDNPPDYLHDLNAMHEAEKALDEENRNHYIDRLGAMYSDSWEFCAATAAQRAEAFLKTIGKWEGE